jgi:DNA-binding CsgD family transcriptional regulator
MITEKFLIRMGGSLAAYTGDYVAMAGTESKEEVLDLFDKMQTLFPYWGIAICPVTHPEIKYASSNCEDIFGEDKNCFINNNGESYFKKVHTADQEDLLRCFEYLHKFLATVSPAFHDQYRSVFHYRFTKRNGEHIYMQDERAVLNLKTSGNLYFGMFKDITEEKLFQGVKVEIFKQKPSLKKVAAYKPAAARTPLSKRESELVALMKQGLSTKEIAGQLKISHNTVRNIKNKMFEKYNVNNTIELLNVTAT